MNEMLVFHQMTENSQPHLILFAQVGKIGLHCLVPF